MFKRSYKVKLGLERKWSIHFILFPARSIYSPIVKSTKEKERTSTIVLKQDFILPEIPIKGLYTF